MTTTTRLAERCAPVRRQELIVALCVAISLITAGVTWLFGPFGLLGVGVVLGAAALALIDVKDA